MSALPAWSGFLSSDLLDKIDSILRKTDKFGYTTEVFKVTDMLQNADNKLGALERKISRGQINRRRDRDAEGVKEGGVCGGVSPSPSD